MKLFKKNETNRKCKKRISLAEEVRAQKPAYFSFI